MVLDSHKIAITFYFITPVPVYPDTFSNLLEEDPYCLGADNGY